MRPPECRICDERFDPNEGGASVTFKRTPSDDDWYRRSETEGFVGHPPNEDWFCAEHVARARELAELSLREAIASWTPPSPPPQISFELAVKPAAPALLAEAFAKRCGNLFQLFEAPVASGIEIPFSSERTWSPTDGATPPNCPFEDRRTAKWEQDGWSLEIRTVVAHWNENEVATSNLSVALSGPDETSLCIVGSQHAPALNHLRISARNAKFDALALEGALQKILSH